MLNLKLTTPPQYEVIDLATAKQHLKVDFSDDDALIALYIEAACEYAESYTGRCLLQSTYTLSLDCFPYYREARVLSTNQYDRASTLWFRSTGINLPKPPCIAVQSVTYVGTDLQPVTLDPSTYLLDTTSEPARLTPLPFNYWPYPAFYVPGSVKITFTAGYGLGDQPTSPVPAKIRMAILMLVGHLYTNRAATSQGVVVSNVPLSVNSLLDTMRFDMFTWEN